MDNIIITQLDEQRIDELLAYAPAYSEHNLENIKKLFTQKTAPTRKSGKRLLLVAAIAALTIALSSIALAASGFSFSSVFNSIFNSKEAESFIQTGDGITLISNNGDVEIEPLAAFFDIARDGIYIELKITDPTGDKLTDSLIFADRESGFQINTGPVEVSFIDINTVIAGIFITPVDAGETTIRFGVIASGLSDFYEEQHTSFNIGEHIRARKPVVVPGAEFIEISNIRLDDGTLTITHRNSDPAVHGFGYACLGLLNPDGEVIYSSFGEDATEASGQSDCFEIGDTDPKDLTLVWSGIRYEHVMTGNWEITVSGGSVMETREFIGEFEGNSTNVTIGATVIEFHIFTDYLNYPFPYDYMADDAVIIFLSNGISVYPRFEGHMNDTTTAAIWYSMDFINPADVVSVIFYGVEMSG